MRVYLKRLVLAVFVMATHGSFASSVTTYLKDVGETLLKSGKDKVSPVTFSTPTVSAHSTGTEVTAYPGEGKKVTGWWYYAQANTHNPVRTGEKVYEGNPIVFKTEEGLTTNLVAHLDYISYDLKYDVADGTWSGNKDQNNITYTSKVTVAASPIRTGYAFDAWRSSPKETSLYPGNVVKGADLCPSDWHEDGSNVTLTAQWTPNAYRINCQLVGGVWTNDFIVPNSAAYDTFFSLPPPLRTGYDFGGWKVTQNLDSATARWGTTDSPASSLTPSTLCVNGSGSVYFKNLNPTNDVTVTLSAQWTPASILVKFNNHGGASGKESMVVTYAAAYDALNVPTKTASAFRGYYLDGQQYWDQEGQPTKSVWDVPTNCWVHAQWDEIPYAIIYDENRTDGKSSKTKVEAFAYGEPVVLFSGDGFENFGCTLLGWSINKQAEKPDDGCGIGSVMTFYESKTLYAVWEKNFFIAYDGNGATGGAMDVQKLVVDKSGQVLNANQYAKTGYGFLGWATNRAAAAAGEWKYADHAVLPQDYAAVLGQTNTLFATWSANTYYLAFDANGGTGTSMPVKSCTYDQPVILPDCTYVNGAYDFVGWSNDVAKAIYANLSEPVSNLCATANGTNTLYAVWKLSDLSAAMKCDNLRWESYAYEKKYSTYVNEWTPVPDGEGAWQTGDLVTQQQWLMAQVPTNGTLVFRWKPVGCEGQRYTLSYWISEDPDNYFKNAVDLSGADDVWHDCVITNVPAHYYVHFYVGSKDTRSYCQIDNMKWTPTPVYPEPTAKDAATISSAAVVDGKFVLSFAGTNVFDYVLKTNADLRVDSWGEMEKTNGAETVTFEPPVLPGLPQLFYKVETVQKK